jgi:hypothetical protein
MKVLFQDSLIIEQRGIEQDEFLQVHPMKINKVMTHKPKETKTLICTIRLAVVAATVGETWTSQAPNKFSQPQDQRRPEEAYNKPKIISRMKMPNEVTFTFPITI